MRSWLGLSTLVTVALAAPPVARAELGNGTLKVDIEIPKDPEVTVSSDQESDYIKAATVDDSTRYFNYARCTCDKAGTDQLYQARISWETVPMPTVTNQLFIWTGVDCAMIADPAQRPATCTELEGINSAADVVTVIDHFEHVGELVAPGDNTMGCPASVVKAEFGVFTSETGSSLTEEAVYEVTPVDMKPPEVPASVEASAEEGQIVLTWPRIDSGVEDYEFFQALCSVEGGALAHDEPTHDPGFDTVKHICNISLEPLEALTLSNDTDVVGDPVDFATLPTPLRDLKDTYICGQANGSATSITLSGLQNNVSYNVVLLAMDKAGNYTARYLPKTVTPQPVTDFWEDANQENPDIEGGLCLIESTYGAGGGGINGALRAWRDDISKTALGRWFVAKYYAWGAPFAAAARENVVARVVLAVAMLPLVAIALVWHAIGLPAMLALLLAFVWLRRRRKLIIAAAITLAPTLAAAQSMTPYWDDDLAASDREEATGPTYHFGIRLGPYLPGIDEGFTRDPGPYERMFGDGSWMPSLDLHRVFGTRFGQVGGGLSVGYFSKTADAFVPGTVMHSPGNENSLKIIPFEATAIYRATQLHDNYRIPLVPYLRGGLGYYLWWVRRPDGEFAKACPADMTNCDRAIGGSLGLVGAVGLAIRAEGIDPSAARSMRDSGLDHAGFYGEVEAAWVDGFGSAKKLSLGDTTWSAGIDFEF